MAHESELINGAIGFSPQSSGFSGGGALPTCALCCAAQDSRALCQGCTMTEWQREGFSTSLPLAQAESFQPAMRNQSQPLN